jgi:hypothetical protein
VNTRSRNENLKLLPTLDVTNEANYPVPLMLGDAHKLPMDEGSRNVFKKAQDMDWTPDL